MEGKELGFQLGIINLVKYLLSRMKLILK